MVKSFANEYLPKKVLEKIDLNTLVISKDSFIDIKLKEKYSDILYSVKLSGKDAYLYFLFEHKSKEDKLVALQLLKYTYSRFVFILNKLEDCLFKIKLLPLVVDSN